MRPIESAKLIISASVSSQRHVRCVMAISILYPELVEADEELEDHEEILKTDREVGDQLS